MLQIYLCSYLTIGELDMLDVAECIVYKHVQVPERLGTVDIHIVHIYAQVICNHGPKPPRGRAGHSRGI